MFRVWNFPLAAVAATLLFPGVPWATGFAQGAALVAAEVVLNDPAAVPGTGMPLDLSHSGLDAMAEAVATLDLSDLEPGPHTLYFRTQDAAGTWSAPVGQTFAVPHRFSDHIASGGENRLVEAEAFFDTDPGQGYGIPLVAEDGAFDLSLERALGSLSLAGLPSGAHTLYMRFRDVAGVWSAPIGQSLGGRLDGDSGGGDFSRSANPLVRMEAFIDVDPGPGLATALEARDGRFDTALEDVVSRLPLSGLTVGVHTLYIRAQDAAGGWSPAIGASFSLDAEQLADPGSSRPNPLAAAEVFFDVDPGAGHGIPVPVPVDGVFDTPLEALAGFVSVAGLDAGIHVLNLRVRDSTGVWSPPLRQSVRIQDPEHAAPDRVTLVGAELSVDGEPAIPLEAVDGSFDDVVEGIDTLLAVSAHYHGVVLRFQDSRGLWSGDVGVPTASGPENDSDWDGLPDSWERYWFGDLSATGAEDPDGDGVSNAEEFERGSNPLLADRTGILTIAGAVLGAHGQPLPDVALCVAGPSLDHCDTRSDALGHFVLGADLGLIAGLYRVVPQSTAISGPYTFAPVYTDVALTSASVNRIDFIATPVPDTAPPETWIESGPAADAILGPGDIEFVWSGSDDRDTELRFEWRLDAGPWSDAGTATSTRLSGLADGPHRLEVRAVDAAGNRDATPARRDFSLDTTPPAPVGAALDGAGDGTTALVDWSGYDEAEQGGVAGYAVFVDSDPFNDVASRTPVAVASVGSTQMTLTGLTRGQTLYVAVVARDAVGNAITNVSPASGQIRDIEPPEDPGGLASQPLAEGLSLSWTPSTNRAGDLAAYRIYLDATLSPVEVGADRHHWDLTGIARAPTHKVRVTSVDADGNESAGARIDAETLAVSLAAQQSGARYRAGDQVSLTWTGNGAPTAIMVLSMKRDMVPASQSAPLPEDPNWRRLAIETPNDGSELLTLPNGLTEADDWRFEIGYASTDVRSADASTFYYQPIPVPAVSIVGLAPADPIQGDLVTLVGEAASPDQTIELWSWNLIRLENGEEVGNPIPVGEEPTLRTDEMTAGDWRVKLQVRNGAGQWSPVASRDVHVRPLQGLADLHIAWSDVEFLDADGQPTRELAIGETIRVRLVLHNDGSVPLPDTAVLRLLEEGASAPAEVSRVLVHELEPGAQTTIEMAWTAPQYAAGYQSLLVSADFLVNLQNGFPVLAEANRFNNQVSQFVIVGDPAPGTYAMALDLPELIVVHPGQRFLAYGAAHYDWGSRLVVMGAQVGLELYGREAQGLTASPAGSFAIPMYAPQAPGDYPLSVTIFDQSLLGQDTITVRVVPWPDPAYWGGGGGFASSHVAPVPPQPVRDLTVDLVISGEGLYVADNGVDAGILDTAVRIEAKLRNVGNLDVVGGFSVEFWDGDPTTDDSAQPIGGPIRIEEVLLAGQSLIVETNEEMRLETLGLRTFYAEVSEVIAETNPYNNNDIARVDVRLNLPDLRPTYAPRGRNPGSLRTASTPLSGVPTRILVDVLNRGPADLADGFDIDFYDGDPDDGGEWIARTSYGAGLRAWSWTTVAVDWLPGAPGIHRIHAIIDPDDVIAEDGEYNNRASADIQVRGDVPHLVLDFVPSTYSVTVGGTVGLQATVSNIGSISSVPTTVTFYQGDPELGGTVIDSVPVGGLTPTSGMSASVDWMALIPAGRVKLCAVINDADAEKDCVTITVTDVPVPDLRLESADISIDPGPSPRIGSVVTVSARIRNISEQRVAHGVMVNFFADSPWEFIKLGGAILVDRIATGESVTIAADAVLRVEAPYYALLVDVSPDAIEGDGNLADNRATTSFVAAVTAETVLGDLDGDGDVDLADLRTMRSRFGSISTAGDDPYDLNQDGVVNVLDYRKAVLSCTRSRCALQ